MSYRIDERKLYKLARKLLKEQEENNSGMPVTYRRMQEIWGYSQKSKASASGYLPKMEARGYVRAVPIKGGKSGHYRRWLANKDAPYNPISKSNGKK